MKLNNLHDLLIHELKDIYDAEIRLIDALPKMSEAATDEELKEAFDHHLNQTLDHKSRLDTIATMLHADLSGETCHGMKGLIMEGEKTMRLTAPAEVKDAALIAAAQRIEHYEIAAYGCVVTYAQELEHNDVADLLKKTLQEEGEANKTLTDIAEGGLFTEGINEQADRDSSYRAVT